MESHEQGPTSSSRASATWIEVAAATRTGLRRTNADALLIDQAADVYAVADGMGDVWVSGLVARKALEAVQQVFGAHWRSLPLAQRAPEDAKFRIARGLVLADRYVSAPYLPLRERIGTTFAGAVACGNMICAAHVGDSRVYLLRQGHAGLVRLTEDHTVLEEDLGRGVPYDVAIREPDAHKLTRVLGVRPGAEIDPILQRWEPRDIAVICTDGVSDHVGSDALERVLLDGEDLLATAQSIVELAHMAGGRDNATIVLMRRIR